MKKLITILALATLLSACGNSEKTQQPIAKRPKHPRQLKLSHQKLKLRNTLHIVEKDFLLHILNPGKA